MATDALAITGVPAVGDVVGGKYRVEAVLGEGGMGKVFAARHTQLGQRVAIKFMQPEFAKAPGASERFLREAHATVAMKGEHVARVIDVDQLESGAPYMIMEFLDGADLGHLIDAGPLQVDVAVSHVLQACEAVAEAHALGIVHRDLKPANLFVTERPDGTSLVKVLDFGIAKALAGTGVADAVKLTSTGVAIGTPAYMAPEQVRDAATVDARSDIWSIGVILYECLTGELPFDASSPAAMCAAIAADPPRPIGQFRQNLPAALEAAVMRCLEKDRERRHVDIAALAVALEMFAAPEASASVGRIVRMSGRRATSPSLGSGRLSRSECMDQTMDASSGAGVLAPKEALTLTPTSQPPRAPSTWRKPWVAGAAIVLGIGGAVAWSALPAKGPGVGVNGAPAESALPTPEEPPPPGTGAALSVVTASTSVESAAPVSSPAGLDPKKNSAPTKSRAAPVVAAARPSAATPPSSSPPPAKAGSQDALLSDRK